MYADMMYDPFGYGLVHSPRSSAMQERGMQRVGRSPRSSGQHLHGFHSPRNSGLPGQHLHGFHSPRNSGLPGQHLHGFHSPRNSGRPGQHDRERQQRSIEGVQFDGDYSRSPSPAPRLPKMSVPTVCLTSVESRQASARNSPAVSRQGSLRMSPSFGMESVEPPSGNLGFQPTDVDAGLPSFENNLWTVLGNAGAELMQHHIDDLSSHASLLEKLKYTNGALRAELSRLRKAYGGHGAHDDSHHLDSHHLSPNYLPSVPHGEPHSLVPHLPGAPSHGDPFVVDSSGTSGSDFGLSLASKFGNLVRFSGMSGPPSARGSQCQPPEPSAPSSARGSKLPSPSPGCFRLVPDHEQNAEGIDHPEAAEVAGSHEALFEMPLQARMAAIKRAASLATQEEEEVLFEASPFSEDSRGSVSNAVEHVETMFGAKPQQAAQKQKMITFADQEDSYGRSSAFKLVETWAPPANTRVLLRPNTTRKHLEAAEEDEDCDSDDEEFLPGMRFMQRFIMKPNSNTVLLWMSMGYLALLYESIVLPLDFLDLEESRAMIGIAWVIRIYWTIHIPISMLTTFEQLNGQFERRVSQVVTKYLQGWFCLDVALAVVDWLVICLDSFAKLGYVRLFRMLRLARLIQVRRMPVTIRKLLHASDASATFFAVMKNLLMMIWFNHVCACIWVGIGKGGESGNSWIDLARELGWDVETKEFMYIHGYRWQLSNFVGESGLNPKTIPEYIYLLLTSTCAFLATCMFVSSITSAMTRLEIAVAHDQRRFALLRQYLTENSISSKVATRVTRNAQFQAALQKRRTPEEQIDLLNVVSEPLRIDLHFEINMKVLSVHPVHLIYSVLSEQVMRQICHTAVVRLHIAAGDILFHAEEYASVPHMYFVIDGKLSYYHQGDEFKPWVKNQWACEAVLWTSWIHYGTARARTECTLAMLSADKFQKLASLDSEENNSFLLSYAQSMVGVLNDTPPLRLTDLADPEIDCGWFVQKAIPEGIAKEVKKKLAAQIRNLKSRNTSSKRGAGLFGHLFGTTNRGSLGSFTDRTSRNSRLSSSFRAMHSNGSVGHLRSQRGHKFELDANIVENTGGARRTRVAGTELDVRSGNDVVVRRGSLASYESEGSTYNDATDDHLHRTSADSSLSLPHISEGNEEVQDREHKTFDVGAADLH